MEDDRYCWGIPSVLWSMFSTVGHARYCGGYTVPTVEDIQYRGGIPSVLCVENVQYSLWRILSTQGIPSVLWRMISTVEGIQCRGRCHLHRGYHCYSQVAFPMISDNLGQQRVQTTFSNILTKAGYSATALNLLFQGTIISLPLVHSKRFS